MAVKITLSVKSAAEGMANMEKCRTKRGDTAFLPPPGGAQAADRVTSWGDIYRNILLCMVNLTKSASLLILSEMILLVILVREV